MRIKENIIAMKKYLPLLILLLFAGSHAIAQTQASIIKPESNNTDYIVTGTEALTATQSIKLNTNTQIKSGSTFKATIIPDAYTPVTFSNENYVFTRSYQRGMISSSGIANNSDVIENISYFDGLGRPMQSIAIKASPGTQDVVTHIGYDNFGRKDKDYLPYMALTGVISTYRTGADASTNNYYIANYSTDINNADPNPFSKKLYDNSPLNRVVQQGAPGSSWALNSGHEIKTDYQTNVANEVKLFTVTPNWNSTLGIFEIALGNASGTIFYSKGELYKTVTKDENWAAGNENTIEEFKDKEGHLILKKNYGVSVVNGNSISVVHETYYVYDSYDNLIYVIPPKADGIIDVSVLNNLCYQYKYDSRSRLIEKKLPGKDWEYIIYDNLDRQVLTQDANLRKTNKWLFTKYDTFSRPVYTGEYVNNTQITRAAVQDLANSTVLSENRQAVAQVISGTSLNYSNVAFPNSGINLFTINYYDNYLNLELYNGTPANAISYGITPLVDPKGLITCSKTRVLTTDNWITSVVYYDDKGRSIYNYNKNNFLNIVGTVKSQYSFSGKILETTSTHQKGVNEIITITDTFTYDNGGKMLTQKQKINGQVAELIVSNTYDNLGQLITKEVGGKITNSNRLQTVDLTYNIRGWLKGINDSDSNNGLITMGVDDLFGYQINYNNPSAGIPLFNGNISQTFWKTANSDKNLKNYNYTYDALNRLSSAIDNLGKFNEIVKYDKNGNITYLKRLGEVVVGSPVPMITNPSDFGVMDDLTYTYDSGNKLMKVSDAAPVDSFGFKDDAINTVADVQDDYSYDDNGNMITDANKGIIDIKYNHLNLPIKITFNSGSIEYLYDATGVKQQKIVNTFKTDYFSGFVYENNFLKFISQPEGYVTNNSGTFDYIYQYKDHLGNVRLSYGDTDSNGVITNTEIIEESNYYPFGLLHKGYNYVTNIGKGNATAQKYKYNGKELQDDNIGGSQLNLYDYGARNYDPALGRWMNIDPLAEKSRRWTPYNYAYDNPMFFVDPDGMLPVNPIYNVDNVSLRIVGNPGYMRIGDNGQRILTQKGAFNGESTVGTSTSIYAPTNSFLEAMNSILQIKNADLSGISNSASVTTTSVSGTFKNGKGETVNSAKDASTLTVNKREKTETVSIDESGQIGNSVSVKTVDSSTTYKVSTNEDGDKVLSNPSSLVSTNNETVPYSSSSQDLRDYSFEKSKSNIETNMENNSNHEEAARGVIEKLRE